MADQPISTPAPEVQTPPPPAVDLSALSGPGASVTNQPAPSVAGTSDLGGAMQRSQTAMQTAADLAKPEPPAAPVPHARLLSMVQGLADGLSAFGTSLATHGREGGAQQVIQMEGERKAQQQQAQAAAMAQKNAKIQQQLMIADTNDKLAHQILFMATIPDEITKSHLAVTGEQQGQAIQGADFASTHGGMTPDQFNQALTGTNPAAGATGPSSFFLTNAQQQVSAAAKILGDDDQYVKELKSTIANPNATPKDLWGATQRLQTQLGLQEKATQAQTQKATLAKDELAQSQARVADAAWRKAVPKDAQGNPTMDFETWQKTQQKNLEQAITQGSPDLAGQQLASGVATLAELKARGATPEFIQKTIQAAQKYDPKYNASDEIVGEQSLKAPANQTFFGSARSLTQKGGMLDQLKSAHNALQNEKIPVLNKYENWLNYQAGSDALSSYKAAVLGAADDYAKVVGGGNPTDSARDQARDQFIADLNKGQFDSAVEVARSAIRSQVTGRIGTNRYVAQREGDILADANSSPVANHPTPPGSPASKLHANMSDFAHQFAGKNGTIFSDDGKVWYDTNGNLVK